MSVASLTGFLSGPVRYALLPMTSAMRRSGAANNDNELNKAGATKIRKISSA